MANSSRKRGDVTRLLVAIASACFPVVAQVQDQIEKRALTSGAAKAEITEEGLRTRLLVDAPRPLAAAAEALETRYGWTINYEDPIYHFSTDLVDTADSAFLAVNPNGQRLGPRFARIDLTFEVTPEKRVPANPLNVLQALVSEHNRTGNPGVFNVIAKDVNTFDIRAVQSRSRSGELTAHAAVLDSLITIPEQEVTALQALNEIRAAAGAVSSAELKLGLSPNNILINQTVRLAASNEPAREVLRRTLIATGWKLAWWLYSRPRTQHYFLNIHIVSMETTTRFGNKVLRPVR